MQFCGSFCHAGWDKRFKKEIKFMGCSWTCGNSLGYFFILIKRWDWLHVKYNMSLWDWLWSFRRGTIPFIRPFLKLERLLLLGTVWYWSLLNWLLIHRKFWGDFLKSIWTKVLFCWLKGYYRCIQGKVNVAKKLTTLPFDMICFTGSSETGKLVAI